MTYAVAEALTTSVNDVDVRRFDRQGAVQLIHFDANAYYGVRIDDRTNLGAPFHDDEMHLYRGQRITRDGQDPSSGAIRVHFIYTRRYQVPSPREALPRSP